MTGEGTKIDTSLLGSQIRLMGFSMTRVLFTNEDMPRGRARVSGGAEPGLLVLSMIRTAGGLPFKSWVKKPGKKGWLPLVSVRDWQKWAVQTR